MKNSTLNIILFLLCLSIIGCDKQKLGLAEPVDIYIPNIFSPSSSENNVFYIHTASDNLHSELMANMEIFDRYGSLIFNQQNFPPNEAAFGWNGTYEGELVEAGTYTYSIELTDGFGNLCFMGDFTLVR